MGKRYRFSDKVRTARWLQDPFILLLILTSLAVVSVFIVYPLFCILKTSVCYKGSFSLDTFRSTLATAGFHVAFWNSMKLGFGAALTSTLVGLLFAYQEACVASLQQTDPGIEEAGRDLGGSSNKVFWSITIPLIKTSFFSGLVFTFIKSMTAISAVIFLVSGKYSLLTTKIMIYVDKGRFDYTAAAAAILIAIVFLVVGIASKLLSKMGVSGDEMLSGLS